MLGYAVLVAGLAALAYQLAALAAGLHRLFANERPASNDLPGVSILKPVRGRDPHFFEAIRSHAEQAYGHFEILFGTADSEDPAIDVIERLASAYPDVPIRVVCCPTKAPNQKVGVLEALAAEARYPILLVSDSDITVPPGYLEAVVAPLQDDRVGLVTCLYRGRSDHWPGRVEALGIATDFAPSVLVAPLVGVREFGLGSTLVFRTSHLAEIGGFAALRDYLADDYQLARRITELGYRVHLSKTVVETEIPGVTWSGVWKHQVRWHRTIRFSKGAPAYWGISITHATLWAALIAAFGWPVVGAAILTARLAAGLMVGGGVLRDPTTARLFWLIPVRDLFGVGVWAAGLLGDTVEWRGRRLRLSSNGQILSTELVDPARAADSDSFSAPH